MAASAAANAFTNALAAVRARAAPASAASGTTARPTDPLLQVDALQQYYGGSHILRNVGFSAAVGEVTVVLGRNGVGKTTLLKSLMGVVPVRSGSVRFGGADITAETPYQRARRGIGYVPQGREIFPLLTVAENIHTGLASLPRRERYVQDEIFDLFPVLQSMLKRRGGDLSGGQQQQLAIARALVTRPRLLILDEPTEGIQPSIIKDIGRVIRTLADVGLVVDGAPRPMAIVLVEQYYDFAAELADRYLVMERGEVVQRGRGADMHADGVRARMSI